VGDRAKKNAELRRGTVPLRTGSIKRWQTSKDIPQLSSPASGEKSRDYESEENDRFCGFCRIKYCDPIIKIVWLGEAYHNNCADAKCK